MPVRPTTGRFPLLPRLGPGGLRGARGGSGPGAFDDLVRRRRPLAGRRGVVSLERDPEVAEDWRRNIADAGLEEWAELIEGDALEALTGVEEVFNVIFIDAKKEEYERYFELARHLVDPGGLILRRQRPLARSDPRRLQRRAPERSDAPQRDGPARQRARADDRAQLGLVAPHSSGSTSRRSCANDHRCPSGSSVS